MENNDDIKRDLVADHLTDTTEFTDVIEDITLTGDEDISVPRALERITMAAAAVDGESNIFELSDDQIDAIKEQFAGKKFAFCAVSCGLGVAVKDESGYWPVPAHWYANDSYMANYDYADQLNEHALGLEQIEAGKIVLSSMRDA